MKISPEVLTYIQTVKNFLKKNEDANKYFLNGVNEKIFFEHLSDIAQKNFKTSGEPQLSKEQFDSLRKTMLSLSIVKKPTEEFSEINKESDAKIFIDYRGLGKICLN